MITACQATIVNNGRSGRDFPRSRGAKPMTKGNLEGGGDGFPNPSRVLLEHGHSLIITREGFPCFSMVILIKTNENQWKQWKTMKTCYKWSKIARCTKYSTLVLKSTRILILLWWGGKKGYSQKIAENNILRKSCRNIISTGVGTQWKILFWVVQEYSFQNKYSPL